MPTGGIPNYLGPSNLNAMLDFQLGLMQESRLLEEQRAEREQERFSKQARVLGLMMQNYHATKSMVLRQHIANTMRGYWGHVDPELRPVMEPMLKGSPLDEQVEKMEFFTKMNPYPKRPIKMPDQDEKDYNQQLAEHFYGTYLWERDKNRYMGIEPGELQTVLPIGTDENGKQVYTVKLKDSPARLVTADQADLTRIAKEKNILPGPLMSRPVLEESPTIVDFGVNGYHTVRKTHNLITGEHGISVEEAEGLSLKRAAKMQKLPKDFMEFADLAGVDFNYNNVDEKNPATKPGYLKYKMIAGEMEKKLNRRFGWSDEIKDENIQKAADNILLDRMSQLWPGWQFQVAYRGGKYKDGHPFAGGVSFRAVPGMEYYVVDPETNKPKTYILDEETNTVYGGGNFEPLGTREDIEQKWQQRLQLIKREY